MSKKILLLVLVFAANALSAQELVPATSEDIQEFDRQIVKKAKTDRPSNFGSEVSAEARKLKDQNQDTRNEFGQWVSSQRKKSDQGQPSASGSAGNGNGKGNAYGNANNPAGNRGKKPDKKK